MRQIFPCFLFVCIAVVAAHATEINGKWRGAAATGTEILLDLKADSDKVTGTVALNRGKMNPIADGRFEDGVLTFTMPSMYGNGTVNVKGTLDGEELALTLESERGSTTARLKREATE